MTDAEKKILKQQCNSIFRLTKYFHNIIHLPVPNLDVLVRYLDTSVQKQDARTEKLAKLMEDYTNYKRSWANNIEFDPSSTNLSMEYI